MKSKTVIAWIIILAVLANLLPPLGNVQARSVNAVSAYEMILAMNTLRMSYGLPALIEDSIVNAVAQNTAQIMAANNMSWHIGDVRGRIQSAGYGGGAKVFATENFAVGNMSIDEIMQVWADPDHMRPAVNPAYCHVGAGVAKTADGRYYYILQAAYVSGKACGEYKSVTGETPQPGQITIPQIIVPVKIATPDADGTVYHVVETGQSFWSIAIAYKVTIHDLEVWNNLSRVNGLRVGQRLFVPSNSTEGYATPTPVGMIVPSQPDAEGKITHTVQAYQTLTTIAKAYEVTVDRILVLNGIQKDWPLQIDQKLLIDPGNVTPSPTPRPLTAVEKLTPASDGNYYHTVQSGEYLAWIADLYDVPLNDLMAWNGLNAESIIRIGQNLILQVTPPVTPSNTPRPPSATPTSTHTPVPPSATRSPTAAVTQTLPAAEPDAQDGFPSWGFALVGVLAIAGAGWLFWSRRRVGGNPE